MTNFFTRLRRRLSHYRLKANRTVIISFPKSGRTWLRVMLDDLGLSPRFDHAGAARWGDSAALRTQRDSFARSRVLFLHRHPLDTLVSWYFHEANVTRHFTGSLSEFVRDERCGIALVLRFNRLWLEDPAMFRAFEAVRYEDLRNAPVEELGRIIRFLGGRPDTVRIAGVVAGNALDKMKQRERSGDLARRFPGRFAEQGSDDNAFKVREGSMGGFRKHLSDDDLRYCGEVATRLGWPTDEEGLPTLAAPLQR